MTDVLTKYLPSDWLDEVVPAAQEKPSAFLRHDDKRGWFLFPVDEDDPEEDEGEEDPSVIKLHEGDVVKFYANRVFGDFKLTIAADGVRSTDRPIPTEANCFRHERENESIATSLSELIQESDLQEGVHDIDAYYWSDRQYLFRFKVADGKGTFVPCGAVQ